MEHTPGPWRIVEGNTPLADTGDFIGYRDIATGEGANLKLIAELENSTAGEEEEQEANARLIAAAPDLYEALNALAAVMVKEFGEEIKYRPVAVGQYLDRAFQALTKAERKAKVQP